MSLTEESNIFMATKILQHVAAMLIVLSPDLSGDLNSIVTGIVYLSLNFFISHAYLIMRSLIFLLYRFLAGLVAMGSMESSFELQSDK